MRRRPLEPPPPVRKVTQPAGRDPWASPGKENTMTPTPMPIAVLTEEEVSRCLPPNEEAGFGSLATPRGHLPLKALDVQARLDGLLADVTVTQTFVNTLDEALEATYIFPLPD